jgi:hypothetical protein
MDNDTALGGPGVGPYLQIDILVLRFCSYVFEMALEGKFPLCGPKFQLTFIS